MNKKIISLFLLYFFQLIASSCDPCNCEPARTYERIYNGIELKSWDTSGFQNEEITGTVNKNSFGLTISVEFELNQIAFYKPKLDISSFGFASAYALSCDCEPDEYINIDPIDFISITVIDTQSQEITNVTDNFYTYDYDGEQITISELFQNRADWHDGFQLDMIEYDNIPDTSIFEVKIILESGTELIEQTQEINFE
jgi:hypothetical protein